MQDNADYNVLSLYALWDTALTLLEKRVPASRYRGLILCMTPLPASDFDHVLLGISDEFRCRFAEGTCKDIIVEVLSSLAKHPVKVTIITDATLTNNVVRPGNEDIRSISDHLSEDRFVVYSSDKLNYDQKFTFDSFVVGDQNAFAYHAAMAVAEAPNLKSGFNPLFIWGSSGLGKTHLLQAIGSCVKEIYPDKKVIYTTTEEFANQYVKASTSVARKFDIGAFRYHYQTTDILLIDDIQFLEGNLAMIDQLYSVIDFIKGRGKQIVIASDRSLLELNMDERYISCFSNGLQVEIQRAK